MIKRLQGKFLLILIIIVLINISMKSNYGKQGIEGYVYRISGNQMPSPNKKPSAPKGTKTTIYFYELTNINQITKQPGTSFYSNVKTKFIKKTESDSTGHFKINLPPGDYSIFTKKDTLFFANRFDNNNNIAPAKVLPGKITKVEIRVDYDAAY
jgi:hypothetical protein